jgi:hypothetical protein
METIPKWGLIESHVGRVFLPNPFLCDIIKENVCGRE